MPQLVGIHKFLAVFLFTAALQVLPDLDSVSLIASTTRTHIVSRRGAKWNVHALCISKPCELARNSKTSRAGSTFGYQQCSKRLETAWDLLTWNSSLDEPYSSVSMMHAWKSKRTYSSIAWRNDVCVREPLTLLIPPHRTPPHPTPHPWIHAPIGSHSVASTSCASSHER